MHLSPFVDLLEDLSGHCSLNFSALACLLYKAKCFAEVCTSLIQKMPRLHRLFLRQRTVATAASVSAASVGDTHLWQSGPVLLALLLALVHEPSVALVVDAEHLTISAILAPPPRHQQALDVPHWAHSLLCTKNSSPSHALRNESASCPSSDKDAPTQPTNAIKDEVK